MFELVWTTLKYLGLAFLALLVYLIYTLIIVPYNVRKKYLKYKNVFMFPNFTPFVGDLINHLNDEKDGKVHYHHRRVFGDQLEGKDLKLVFEGPYPVMFANSSQAIKEFTQMLPEKIDKNSPHKGIIKVAWGSYSIYETTDYTLKRRKTITSLLNLNSASKYIPLFLDCCKEVLDGIKSGETVNFQHKMNQMTFSMFTKVLFGNDIGYLTKTPITFTDDEGKDVQIPVSEAFIRICSDYMVEYYHPVTLMFPILSSKGWYPLFRRYDNNFRRFQVALKKMLDTSKDENSVASQLRSMEEFPPEDVFSDLTLKMLGGTETSSHSFTSCFYYLKKHPHVLEKVRKELESYGITKEEINKNGFGCITKEKIMDMSYMACFLKEVFRYDATVNDTFNYEAKEDIQICGVPIPKGMTMKIEVTGPHFSEVNWVDPWRFEPDRFDPETEFGNLQKTTKPSDPMSRRTFGFGQRSCPGQTFATLELKVGLSYLVTMIDDFKIPEDVLNNDGAGFGLASKIDTNFKIYK